VNQTDLAGPLLRSVSRSFYLTIRLLPEKLRAPIGLAYLLARASDTIADSPGAPAPVRREHLAAFREMIREENTGDLAALQTAIASPHRGEQELIAQLPSCLDWLRSQPEFDRGAIVAVLEKIIHGQTLDLERFPGRSEVRALPNAAALEEYTYLVAGCVGEFWTQLCAHHVPRYSDLPLDSLSQLGVDFGKGLQLVNILRDIQADLADGRCYLPCDDPARAASVFPQWHVRATLLLDSGRRYILAIRPARIRAGCFLPWYLGERTLRLLHQQSPFETPQKIKVPHSTVRTGLFLALLAAFTAWPLGRKSEIRNPKSETNEW
jgi:farnesyl-diphosphate farnesyltransferase